MKEENERRIFLKKVGLGSLGASAPSSFLFARSASEQYNRNIDKKALEPGNNLANQKYNTSYIGKYLDRVAFPIGGMGAGMFCLEGTGSISHMSIRHRPELYHTPNMFAAIAVKGIEKGAKV